MSLLNNSLEQLISPQINNHLASSKSLEKSVGGGYLHENQEVISESSISEEHDFSVELDKLLLLDGNKEINKSDISAELTAIELSELVKPLGNELPESSMSKQPLLMSEYDLLEESLALRAIGDTGKVGNRLESNIINEEIKNKNFIGVEQIEAINITSENVEKSDLEVKYDNFLLLNANGNITDPIVSIEKIINPLLSKELSHLVDNMAKKMGEKSTLQLAINNNENNADFKNLAHINNTNYKELNQLLSSGSDSSNVVIDQSKTPSLDAALLNKSSLLPLTQKNEGISSIVDTMAISPIELVTSTNGIARIEMPAQAVTQTNLIENSTIQSGLSLKNDFSPNLALRIQWIYQQALSSAEILMDPAELGPLSVKLNNRNGETNIVFQVSNLQTKEMVEDNLSKLKDLLAEQGINLGETQVEHQQKNEKQTELAEKKGVNESNDIDESQETMVQDVSARLLDTYI